MKKMFLSLCLFILGLAINTGYASAAGLNFNSDTTVVLGGNNYTIATGSTAETISGTGTAALTVTLIAGESFSLSSASGFALVTSPAVFSQVCGSGTNSVTLSGAGTFTITPNPAVAQCANLGGLGHIIVNTPPVTPTPPVIPPVQLQPQCGPGTFFNNVIGECQSRTPAAPISIPGCASNVGSSTTTGQPCATNTVNTGLIPIAGCGNSSVGFSTDTGVSCANNIVLPSVAPSVTPTPTPIPIAGCGNSTSGFSTGNGQSCANNIVTSPVNLTLPTHTAYDFGIVVMRNGSTGSHVTELQRFLNRFLNLALVLDGNLGPKTASAIKEWQSQNNLVADGIVGPITTAQMTNWAATH